MIDIEDVPKVARGVAHLARDQVVLRESFVLLQRGVGCFFDFDTCNLLQADNELFSLHHFFAIVLAFDNLVFCSKFSISLLNLFLERILSRVNLLLTVINILRRHLGGFENLRKVFLVKFFAPRHFVNNNHVDNFVIFENAFLEYDCYWRALNHDFRIVNFRVKRMLHGEPVEEDRRIKVYELQIFLYFTHLIVQIVHLRLFQRKVNKVLALVVKAEASSIRALLKQDIAV